MLSSLRSQLQDVNADNIDDIVADIKIWAIGVEGYLSFLRSFPELGAKVAQIALANMMVDTEANQIAAIARAVWPSDMSNRLSNITADIAKTEALLAECLAMLNTKDTRSNTLKFSIERLLS